MSIIRSARQDNFAIIPNEVMEDERLTFEAKGVLVYLLCKPNNWRINVTDIRNKGGIGKDKAQRIIKELREAGYIESSILRNEKGLEVGAGSKEQEGEKK